MGIWLNSYDILGGVIWVFMIGFDNILCVGLESNWFFNGGIIELFY